MEHNKKMKELELELLQIQTQSTIKQKEEETKQKEEETKQLQLKLEIERLHYTNSNTNSNTNQDSINWYEKFMKEKTEYSRDYNDKIKMTTLYQLFNTWIKDENPSFKYTNSHRFATHIKNLDFICYKSSMKAFGIKYSGITNRKMIN